MGKSSAHFTDKLVVVQQIREVVSLTAGMLTQLGFKLILLDSNSFCHTTVPRGTGGESVFDAILWLYLKIQDHVLYFFDFSSPFVSCL